jgi:hypothetical protein
VAGIQAGSGVAMHSRTTLQYRIDRFATIPGRFICLVGIDDAAAGADGHALVRVFLGTDEVKSVTVRPGEAPVTISVPVPTGTRSIALIADYGERGSAGDHVDFLWPTLIRQGEP